MGEIVLRAARLVARPIFFSMLIIILAFIPVFALAGQEGKLFHPLAFTKTFAMLGATLLSMTLIPVLISLFVRGKLHDEGDNRIMRFLLWLYRPALEWALRRRKTVLGSAVALLAACCWLLTTFGREFMPPLNEGSLLFMPQTVPSASLPEVNRVMSAQNKKLSAFPEVASVVGKLGRADTATDPAPVGMIETTITLKPREQWREGMTLEKLREEMQQEMFKFPGFPPAFLQPIENRILMLNTGIRGQVAVKIFGENLEQLQELARQAESILRLVPGATGVVAERVTGAPYLEIAVRRDDAARYGVAVGDILDIVETALGGKELTTTIEGRKRYGIRVRYPREMRDSPEKIGQVLVATEGGDNIPLSKVADVRLTMGPSMISSENGLLRVFVQANVEGRDLSGFVGEAKRQIEAKLKLPEGTFISWGGQYENLQRAERTLLLIVPVVLFIIFILLFLVYGSAAEAGHVLLAVPFALTGGVLLQALLGYPFSVAVWVGYIALFGTAVQTGVVMVIYLEEAVRARKEEKGDAFGLEDLRGAVRDGALLRLRPKVMTVSTILASLGVLFLPFAEGRTGIEVMRPIAVPVIGGMISSLLHILIVTPVIFLLLRERELKHEQRKKTP
jgi:Cu(I)/Ag(I) efflux system membrane protein CusA/SilA